MFLSPILWRQIVIRYTCIAPANGAVSPFRAKLPKRNRFVLVKHFCCRQGFQYMYIVRFDKVSNGPLTRYVKLRECGERFPRHQLQRKLLVSDPGMHHCTCVTHVPWCLSGSLTHSGGENVPGIPGVCATHNFTYLIRGPCPHIREPKPLEHMSLLHLGSF